MATTTPNFGWAVPTSTDLVKDGAVAIETLGDSIDASLVDLKGGTTGQVLSKATNTNMDFTWVTPSAGGGGKVLQVVFASTNSGTTNSTNTYADTALTGSITPSASTSRVLVLVTMAGLQKSSGNSGNALGLRVLRGATTIHETDALMMLNSTAQEVWGTSFAANIVDSPATTSSTTYKVQLKNLFNGASVSAGYGNNNASTITLIEIGA
jgi:hypothetical protein